MAYKPTVWVDSETPVNAENLNKLEAGVSAAVVSVNGIAPDENGNVEVAGGSGGNVDLTGYATEQYVQDYAQPKGNYLTEHQDISGKLDASALPTAINTALAQAKASGEFDGADGKDGTSVTVKSVSESTADGGSNVVTFSDGKTLTVKNGSKGATGPKPVKGTDYWTPDEKAAMVQEVIDALGGVPVFGVVDANNNIILSGNLAEGVYTLKYEDAEGNVTEIGTITVAPEPTYTNLADQTSADWLNDKRINSSGVLKDAPGWDMTNFISMSASVKKMHIKGLDVISADSAGSNHGRVYAYNGNKEYADYKQPSILNSYFYAADYDDAVTIFDIEAARTTSSMNSVTNATYLRFGGMVTSDDVVITIDEDIR